MTPAVRGYDSVESIRELCVVFVYTWKDPRNGCELVSVLCGFLLVMLPLTQPATLSLLLERVNKATEGVSWFPW